MHVAFVCSGNICRSPMGEKILQYHLAINRISGVAVTSCGIGGWHVGDPADRRAQRELLDHGYAAHHRAAKFGPRDADADLLLAMDQSHVDALIQRGVDPQRIRLLRSFDPQAESLDCEDPYYGDAADFARVREEIEAAMPELIAFVKARSTASSSA